MKPKAVLLLSLVLAIAAYIAVNHTPGHAQQGPSTVRVREVTNEIRTGAAGTQVPGRIVGFSCVFEPNPYQGTRCYVATTD